MRGCDLCLVDCKIDRSGGNKPPTLEGWPINWLPVGQLLVGVPLTVRVSLLLYVLVQELPLEL